MNVWYELYLNKALVLKTPTDQILGSDMALVNSAKHLRKIKCLSVKTLSNIGEKMEHVPTHFMRPV